MIRIIAIDDHKLFSDGLQAIIDQEDDMLMVNSYDHGFAIQTILSKDKPDILLLDINLPGKSGISIAREIKEKHKQVKIIILSMLVDEVIADKLKKLQVEAYVSKTTNSAELLQIIRKVSQGGTFYTNNSTLNHAITHILSEDFKLTAREIEILDLLQQGKTNPEIAEILCRSLFTIQTHRKNINQKLGKKGGIHAAQQFLDWDANGFLNKLKTP